MKRLLFVTYYFPPSGGPGVQRSLKFVKYLPEFGWRPTVLTVRPESASWPDPDPDSVAEIPEGILVERTGAWDPYALYARLLGRKKQEVISVGFTGEDGAVPHRRLRTVDPGEPVSAGRAGRMGSVRRGARAGADETAIRCGAYYWPAAFHPFRGTGAAPYARHTLARRFSGPLDRDRLIMPTCR